MPEARRAIKDSVFTYLFSQPEYTRQLYLELHPEDQDIPESEIKIVTQENVLVTGQYNDLGLLVQDKLILLAEAQSTFSPNIPFRMLMYLTATYKDYIGGKEPPVSLYGSAPVKLPRPELYVVYTGSRNQTPDVLRLSDVYEGAGDVEVAVRVLRGDGTQSLVGQYVSFCRIADEQMRLHGRTEHAVRDIIRICLEQGILVPFLQSRQKEVKDIMTTLFSQEEVWEQERRVLRYQARQEALKEGRQEGLQAGLQEGRQAGLQEGRQAGLQEGLQAGLQEGRQEGQQIEFESIVRNMREAGLDDERIAFLTGRAIADIQAVKQ